MTNYYHALYPQLPPLHPRSTANIRNTSQTARPETIIENFLHKRCFVLPCSAVPCTDLPCPATKQYQVGLTTPPPPNSKDNLKLAS